MFAALLDAFYPRCCSLCGLAIEEEGTLFCRSCDPLARLKHFELLLWGGEEREDVICCRHCGEPLMPPDESDSSVVGLQLICSLCELYPLPFSQFRSLWRYCPPIEEVIKRWKYGERRELTTFLAGCLLKGVLLPACRGGFAEKGWELVIALPSSAALLRRRGFSHTTLLAREFCHQLGVRLEPFALCARGHRAAQAKLSVDERLRNVQGKFTASEAVIGRRVLLIDDVVTTGSSVAAAAQACLKKGALRVDVLTVARSEYFSRTRAELLRAMRLGRSR